MAQARAEYGTFKNGVPSNSLPAMSWILSTVQRQERTHE
jgi:hypothetical protein